MTEPSSASQCPACARPIATARETCLYCGAVLPAASRAVAAERAERISRSETLPALSATVQAPDQEPSRLYFILDIHGTSETEIADALTISAWEARQWLAGPRYRLIRVASASEGFADPAGLRVHVLEEERIARARNPILVAAVDDDAPALVCQIRPDPEGPPVRREISVEAIRLIVSAPIRRERPPDSTAPRRPSSVRLEDGLFVHLHIEGETRPLEIDPRRTVFEGAGSPSAYMRTLALLRRLAEAVPHDDTFRFVVPALAPSPDTDRDLDGLRKAATRPTKEPRKPTHDNASQFRAYSAWRGVLAHHLSPPATGAR